jgi:predicted Zn-dependent protease
MSARRRLAALALGAALGAALSACASLQQLEVPSLEGLARIGQQALPIGPEKEREIGFGIAATVAGRYRLVQNEPLLRYVNLVGQAVAQQSVRAGEVSFRFGVLDTDEVNAWAAPGGYVLLTRGALALMESEAELAGVLAHELAHVDQKHVIEEIRRSAVFQQATDEAQLQGALLDQISAAGTTLLFTGLSRGDELQADSLGLMYAAAAGYRTDGLLQFLRHLQGAEGTGSAGLRELIATHPATADRLLAVERQLARSGAVQGADGGARFRGAMGSAGL